MARGVDVSNSALQQARFMDRDLCLSEIKHALQMMESAKKWRGHKATNSIYGSQRRRVFVD
jgi:hypothetical protein